MLLDALVHGFIRMERLALLVFDEGVAHTPFLSFSLRRKAHCAIRDHPSNRIMRDFYHPSLAAKEAEIPHILGLTASPTQNNKIGALEYA